MVEKNLSCDVGHGRVIKQKWNLDLKQNQEAPFGCSPHKPLSTPGRPPACLRRLLSFSPHSLPTLAHTHPGAHLPRAQTGARRGRTDRRTGRRADQLFLGARARRCPTHTRVTLKPWLGKPSWSWYLSILSSDSSSACSIPNPFNGNNLGSNQFERETS